MAAGKVICFGLSPLSFQEFRLSRTVFGLGQKVLSQLIPVIGDYVLNALHGSSCRRASVVLAAPERAQSGECLFAARLLLESGS